MPGPYSHTIGKVMASVLVDLGLATLPASAASWPVYAEKIPDVPDNCIVVYTTQGRQQGRTQYDGASQGKPGFQVMVRATDVPTGHAKARAIYDAFDGVLRRTVSVTGERESTPTQYLVQAVTNTSDVLPIGKEVPVSERELFTVNAIVSLTMLS